eukprot:2224690-Rhodomonas_salina.5
MTKEKYIITGTSRTIRSYRGARKYAEMAPEKLDEVPHASKSHAANHQAPHNAHGGPGTLFLVSGFAECWHRVDHWRCWRCRRCRYPLLALLTSADAWCQEA